MPDVDGVVENLPRAPRLGHPFVRSPLAELTLVEDVVGLLEDDPQRPIERVGARAGPPRISDAVLIQQERDTPPTREPQKRTEISRKPRRSEVQDREVRWAVGEPDRKALELRRAAGHRRTHSRYVVMTIEQADARSLSTPGEQPSPPSRGTPITRYALGSSSHQPGSHPSLDEALEQAIPFRVKRPVAEAFRRRATSRDKRISRRRIGSKAKNGPRDGRSIVDLHEHSVALVVDQLLRLPHASRDEGHSGGHRLEHCLWPTLLS